MGSSEYQRSDVRRDKMSNKKKKVIGCSPSAKSRGKYTKGAPWRFARSSKFGSKADPQSAEIRRPARQYKQQKGISDALHLRSPAAKSTIRAAKRSLTFQLCDSNLETMDLRIELRNPTFKIWYLNSGIWPFWCDIRTLRFEIPDVSVEHWDLKRWIWDLNLEF